MIKKNIVALLLITPLCISASQLTDAVENNDLDIVTRMVGKNNVSRDDKDNALIVACEEGYKDIAGYLLTHGARANAQRDDGYTALILAVTNDHPELVKLLLQHNVDVNEPDFSGTTALMYARQESMPDIAQLLVDAGAN